MNSPEVYPTFILHPFLPPLSTDPRPFLSCYDCMSGYSSIFSAGLLATPRPQDHANRADYTTPDCSVNMDSDSDTTPTKLNAVPNPSTEDVMNYFMPRSRASSNASGTSSAPGGVGASHLRRRRSSLSLANNGLCAVKSPQRSAGMALQRTALMSPGGRADFLPLTALFVDHVVRHASHLPFLHQTYRCHRSLPRWP